MVIQGIRTTSLTAGRRSSGVEVRFDHVTSPISQKDGAQKDDGDDDAGVDENDMIDAEETVSIKLHSQFFFQFMTLLFFL